ncbi:MAG: hypothetical protein E6R03_02575 [Hyphomicrobiaceae bacterium]|nr:MAG: hypothetical protein E6R03_02575 [Hyphomicrobiaceae bacterium]
MWSAVGLGKTQQNTIAYTIWLLGRNPRLRIAIVSKTEKNATVWTDTIARHIEKNPVVREVFPNLRPGDKWSTQHRYIDRPAGIAGPSFFPLGIDGSVTGFRIDIIICDDVIDGKNCRIESQREQIYTWMDSVLFSRLEPDTGRVLMLANAWHPEDPNEQFAKRDGWKAYRFPVVVTDELAKQIPRLTRPLEKGGLGFYVGQTVWPGRFSQVYLDKLRKEQLPSEYARARLCKPRTDSDSRFRIEDIWTALERGGNFPLPKDLHDFLSWDDPESEFDDIEVPDILEYFWIVHGVDLSTGDSEDLTAIVTLAIDKTTGCRFILSVVSGRWQAPEIIERITEIYGRFGGIFMVENNACQAYIRQMLGHTTAIPIVKYTTGKGKADPRHGIESIAQELYQKKWVIPSIGNKGATPDIEHLVEDMKGYTPPPAHTGDRLMALWFAQILGVRLERKHYRRGRSPLGSTQES